MGRKGRPRKQGERYPSGQPKLAADPIAPAVLHRIRTDGIRLGLDPRLGCELGRLMLLAQMTTTQAAAGFRMAEIYGRYERFKGKRRTVASPSYQSGMRGESGIAEELMTDEELGDLEDRVRSAERDFLRLQDEFVAVPALAKAMGRDAPAIRDRFGPAMLRALEELCVADQSISPVLYEDAGKVLDYLARFFGITSAPKKGAQAQRPAAKPEQTATPHKPNIDRIYWMEVVKRLRPDLSDADLGKAYDVQQALKARASFRRAKERVKAA